MFEKIPQILKDKGLWCCWKKTERGKVPYDCVRNTYAKSNDRKTFCSFDTAMKYLPQYYRTAQDGALLGGIGLGIFNGFSAIDIDHCIDNGVISDMAKEIISYCHSYTEISPSGTGIRIIFTTDFDKFDKDIYYTNNSKLGLEIYIEGSTNKFVTITGNAITNNNIVNVNIEYILNKYMRKQDKLPFNQDAKLNELWNNVAPGSNSNESELDLALCSKLAFYLKGDADEIREAFESSPYYLSKDTKHRKKWDTVYSVNTINKAIATIPQVMTPTTNYDLTDTGNAHRFVDEFGEDLKYNVDNKMWMMWNGVQWQFDVFGSVRNKAEDLIENMRREAFSCTDGDKQKKMLKNIDKLCNKSGKDNMLFEAQHMSMIPVCMDTFDRNDFILNCQNGVIDLRTGILKEHNKMLLLNKICDASYVESQPKRFLAFLNDIFEGNQEIIHYLHKAFGYTLTGSCEEQCMFILQGDGNDGKSLLLQIIQDVIGDYSATSQPELLLDKKTQSANLSEVARLKGIRYCVVNELKMGDRLNEAGVKDITSGNNKIVARFLYGNEFEFIPKFKVWLATNYEPRIYGTDKGIWRRIVKIPCKRNLQEHEVDKNLIYKLREEKDAILCWLVDGCLLWQREGLKMPACLEAELKEYKTNSDLIQQWINECCETNNSYVSRSSELFENFKKWCATNNEYQWSATLFGRNFSKKFDKAIRSGVVVYKGVRLKNEI